MTAREKHVVAHHLLRHLDEIQHCLRQRRWSELAAVVEYVQTDVPNALSKTDPHLYLVLRHAVTEFHLRGFDQLNLHTLRELAHQSAVADRSRPQGKTQGSPTNEILGDNSR